MLQKVQSDHNSEDNQIKKVKVAFLQKVRCVFHIAKINIPNIRKDSDLQYLFWQCEKHIALSEKKQPLTKKHKATQTMPKYKKIK